MFKNLTELYQYRELLVMLTWRDIRIKYKQSIMGFMWAIFMPVIIISTGILVKAVFSKISGKPLSLDQIASVSVKSLPWSFWVSAIRFATNSLTSNMNLVTKIYFPKEIFPLSAVFSQLFDFMIAACVLFILLAIANIGFSVYMLYVPTLLLLFVVLALGTGLLMSAANLFFRDVKYLVEVILTFAIFFVPVFYEVEIAGRWGWVLLLNPVAPILEGLNSVIVSHAGPNIGWVLYSAIFSVFLFITSFNIFKKLEPIFAENV